MALSGTGITTSASAGMLARQLAPLRQPRLVQRLAVDQAVGAREVDVFEDAHRSASAPACAADACAGRRRRWSRSRPARRRGRTAAPIVVQRAALRCRPPSRARRSAAAAERAEAHTGRARRPERIARQHRQAVGALRAHRWKACSHALRPAAARRMRDQHLAEHLGVAGGDELRRPAGQLVAQPGARWSGCRCGPASARPASLSAKPAARFAACCEPVVRVAGVADGHVRRPPAPPSRSRRASVSSSKTWLTSPSRLCRRERDAVGDRDPGRLLAAMLQRVQTERKRGAPPAAPGA